MLNKLTEEMKAAMKAKDVKRLEVIRGIIFNVKLAAKEKKADLSDGEISEIVMQKMKQTQDAMTDFKKGNRQDLVDEANIELGILAEFRLPMLSDEEILAVINKTKSKVPEADAKNMKKMIGLVKAATVGQAEARKISELLRANM